MDSILLAGILGGFGGAVRATIGLSKSVAVNKKIHWDYWILTCAIAVAIGTFAGLLLDFDYKISLLAGYAGTDIIEGLYKSFNLGKGFVVVK